jgi:hypothetical protein
MDAIFEKRPMLCKNPLVGKNKPSIKFRISNNANIKNTVSIFLFLLMLASPFLVKHIFP